MKRLNSKYTLYTVLALFLSCPEDALAQANKSDEEEAEDIVLVSKPELSRYGKRIHRFREGWNSLILTHNKIQFIGNMGMFSFGTGRDYGRRDQWETDLSLGFILKHNSHRTKLTMILKQSYMPWSLESGKGFSTESLSCGFYSNTVFGHEFWVEEPSRYPEGYYGFSPKIRAHIFSGQWLTYNIDKDRCFFTKSIIFFYESSTYDLLLISRVTNRYLRARDYLSLSFGLKFQWL